MPNSIKFAVDHQLKGYYTGNRLILPFRCQLIKLIVNKEIFTEFVGSNDIKISQDPHNTSIYLRIAGRLSNFVDTYQNIKMIVAEMDSDLCERDKHIKLICEIKDNRTVNILVPGDDILFID